MRQISSILSFFVIIGAALALSACSSSKKEKDYATLYLPVQSPKDPSDEVLKETVAETIRKSGAPAASTYEFKRYDLNGDGRRDALVFLKTPYGYWCNIYGCTMLVMEANDNHFNFVNHVQPVREPVYISKGNTNGWQDLVIRVSGRWNKAKDVTLSFDGRAYPKDPEDLPPANRFASQNSDLRVFYE